MKKVSKWTAISGSWAYATKKEEKDVRSIVRKTLVKGGGIVTGGALNVDSFATDEAIKFDPNCYHIKIFLPTTLKVYSKHYRKRAKEGVITQKQAEDLIAQLQFIFKANANALIEKSGSIYSIVNILKFFSIAFALPLKYVFSFNAYLYLSFLLLSPR